MACSRDILGSGGGSGAATATAGDGEIGDLSSTLQTWEEHFFDIFNER